MSVANILKTDKELTIIGDEAKTHFVEIMRFMQQFRVGVDLVGPPGSGKSHIGSWVAIEYSKFITAQRLRNAGLISTTDKSKMSEKELAILKNPPDELVCPAYFIPMDRETSKTGVIMGYRMDKGSTIPVKSAVAEAMERGGVVAIDELTHSLKGIPLMFNTILDRSAKTAIGDMSVEAHKDFRVVFMHNTVGSAGNTPLAPSFASRPLVWYIDYPGIESETKIAKKIWIDDMGIDLKLQGNTPLPVPDVVIRYATSYMREIRAANQALPVSSRNVSNFLCLLTVLPNRDLSKLNIGDTDPHFNAAGTTGNAMRRKIAARIFWKEEAKVTDADLSAKEVLDFMKFVTLKGVERFRIAMLQAFMYYLDVDGVNYSSSKAKEDLKTSAI